MLILQQVMVQVVLVMELLVLVKHTEMLVLVQLVS
jgi:hypothetical protein